VRYAVYPLAEMDQPVDGLIYATAVGLGFASYRGFRYVDDLGGDVLLSVAANRIAVITLAHASFAAVTGLALGWAKFSPSGPLRRGLVLGGGLAAAIALNGQYALVDSAIAGPGLGFTPWRSVAYGFGFAAAVFVAVSFLMRRALAVARRAAQAGA
jgi:RsiW-degrading membrane proteinase PrsW (M82 family)